jgi:hypothetical protein
MAFLPTEDLRDMMTLVMENVPFDAASIACLGCTSKALHNDSKSAMVSAHASDARVEGIFDEVKLNVSRLRSEYRADPGAFRRLCSELEFFTGVVRNICDNEGEAEPFGDPEEIVPFLLAYVEDPDDITDVLDDRGERLMNFVVSAILEDGWEVVDLEGAMPAATAFLTSHIKDEHERSVMQHTLLCLQFDRDAVAW